MPARPLTIFAALEWAFATERAQLDFAEEQGDNARPGVSPLWTILQRGALGCTIDGGGHSLPALDADIIASAVAHLPDHLGGRRMALTIAECARAGRTPDWRTPPAACVPVAWKGENQHGRIAATEEVDRITYLMRGRKVQVPVLACPVRYVGSPDLVLAVRARYTAWRAALGWLLQDLRGRGTLTTIALQPGLPPAEPWAPASPVARVA